MMEEEQYGPWMQAAIGYICASAARRTRRTRSGPRSQAHARTATRSRTCGPAAMPARWATPRRRRSPTSSSWTWWPRPRAAPRSPKEAAERAAAARQALLQGLTRRRHPRSRQRAGVANPPDTLGLECKCASCKDCKTAATPRPAVHAAGRGAAAAVPHLSAQPGRLAGLHRHQDRPRAASGSAWRTTSSCGATSVTRLALFNTLFYTVVASVLKFVLGLWLALLLNEQHPVQDLLPHRHPAALHRAHRAVGHRLLVDLRRAVLDRQLGAGEGGPDRPLHRLSGRPLERAAVHHRRQHLARRALRRDHAAGRPADHLAVALRGRRRSTAPPAGSASATSRCRC